MFANRAPVTTGSNKKGRVKISVSIIGDAFVDLFCYLDDSGLPAAGGDVRVNTPINPVAGGSGLNTATQLSALLKYFEEEQNNEGKMDMDVTLQTSFNDSDEYGKILASHAAKHDFQLINCYADDTNGTEDANNDDSNSHSTGHCIVIVSRNERSFMTHLGCMGTFKAADTILHELVGCRTADPTFINHHHHIHIAGYYNISGFWKGKLKRRLNLVREKRRNRSHGLNVYTTTTSLVPQYDATEEWGGQLLEVLPLIDFLILNSLEAGKISHIPITDKDGGTALDRAVFFLQMAQFFYRHSPSTYVIITLGKRGAVALYGGQILISADCPETFEEPKDPTGAGDAFAAGFLNGVMKWRSERLHYETTEIGSEMMDEANNEGEGGQGQGSWTNAVLAGMSWGCSAGTSCVSLLGASVPVPKSDMMKYMKLNQDEDEETEEEDANEEKKEEEEDDTEVQEKTEHEADPQDISEASNENSTPPSEESSTLPKPVIFCGPSGVGKDTLINMLKKKFSEEHFGSVVSHTTRSPREGEVDGVHYHFTNVETMEKDIANGDFIEFAKVHSNYYGTSFKALKDIQMQGKICLLDLDVQGVRSIKSSSLNPFYVFISPPSVESLEFRLRMRGTESEDTIKQRLTNASAEMEYGSGEGNFDNVFVNDDLNTTFSNLAKQFLTWFPELASKERSEDSEDGVLVE